MKKILNLLVCISILDNLLFAQFIIIRKNNNGHYGPLVSQDIVDERIAEILMKYTWPSCIAQDLSKEKNLEFLLPTDDQEENLEEKFIRAKIQELSPDLDIVFIPNTLYELFIIKFEHMKNVVFNIDKFMFTLLNSTPQQIEEFKQFKKFNGSSLNFLKDEINNPYNFINFNFFKKNDNNLVLSLVLHQKFMEFVLDFNQSKFFASVQEIFNYIYKNSEHIKNKIIWSEQTDDFLDILSSLRREKNDTISKCIQLDYIAYKKNMALLYRGSSFINRQSIFGKSIKIIGSTIHEVGPYSISFGNSLFAGFFKDKGACVYNFLEGNVAFKKDEIFGYALFINKYLYIQNSIANLFFISGICLEAALYSQGEWFHSRTKPSTLKKFVKPIAIIGLAEADILDPLGVFIVRQDPYMQATLFSKYMANNIAILERGTINSQTQEEKDALKKLLEDQDLLKKEYTIINFLNKRIRARRVKKELSTQTNQVALQDTSEKLNWFGWLYDAFKKN